MLGAELAPRGDGSVKGLPQWAVQQLLTEDLELLKLISVFCEGCPTLPVPRPVATSSVVLRRLQRVRDGAVQRQRAATSGLRCSRRGRKRLWRQC